MYGYQIKRLFTKYLFLILACILSAAAIKILTIYRWKNDIARNYMSEKETGYYTQLLESTSEMSLEQRSKYIYDHRIELSENTDEELDDAINRYEDKLRYCYIINGIINYAKTGKGLVDAYVPNDLNENSVLYASLEKPTVINDEPFLKFLDLQSRSIMPIIVLLITGVFIADSYEKRLHLMINISKCSKQFYKSRETVIVIFIFLIYSIDFIVDLLASGYLASYGYMNAAIQSVPYFIFSHIDLTVGETIRWLYIVQLISLYICYNIFVLISRAVCSIKKYITISAAVIIVMSAFSSYFPEAAPYMFASICDKKMLLSSISYIKMIEISEIITTPFVFLLILVGILTWRSTGYYDFDIEKI